MTLAQCHLLVYRKFGRFVLASLLAREGLRFCYRALSITGIHYIYGEIILRIEKEILESVKNLQGP